MKLFLQTYFSGTKLRFYAGQLLVYAIVLFLSVTACALIGKPLFLWAKYLWNLY